MFKKPWFMLILGFALGALVVWWPSGLGIHTFMIVETKSSMGYEDTLQAIKETTLAKGWKVPTIHRLDKTMAKFGHKVAPTAVVELCHPTHAAKILKEDDARMVSSFMPCRISIYEKSDGTVIISRMNSSLMSSIFPDLIATVMADATSEVEDIIDTALENPPKAVPPSGTATDEPTHG
ncbi:MAG: DUF302 domain-containing protein [Pseudomonadota bacterium]|nr:DUF302 domain-containing protein [Pseudomonadota bacterium]